MYVDFRFPLEPAGGEERKSGGEQKSADIERKTVELIYPYPKIRKLINYPQMHNKGKLLTLFVSR